MRALRYNGETDGVVRVPAWVQMVPTLEAVDCVCTHCGSEERVGLAGVKRERERLLGRFARWHARCTVRPEIVIRRPHRTRNEVAWKWRAGGSHGH